SGNEQSNVPPATVGEPTSVPPVPQVGYPAAKLSGSPSASEAVKVYVLVWPSFAVAGALLRTTVDAELATVTESVAVEPSKRPSFGVTSTETVWPLSPFPAVARLNVSVRLA